jgi:ferredoxin-NADP reductase
MENEKEMKIIERTEIAHNTHELKLGIDPQDPFVYKAGQYVILRVDHKINDGRGPTRAFSLSSSPNNKEFISTCFRLPEKHSDFKDYIMRCPFETKIYVKGPLGKFVLPEYTDRPIVMIAGGVGITPFISMLRRLTEEKSDQEVLLLYTDKSEENTAYFDVLTKLEGENERFKFLYRTKRVDKEFIKDNCNLEKSLFYICGTPGMAKGVKNLLQEMGVCEEQINFENFSGY